MWPILTFALVSLLSVAFCFVVPENPEVTTNRHPSDALDPADLVKHRFRQDGWEGNVGSIVTGVLGGGLGSIFQGSSGFIGDTGVKQEVDFVLNNVAPPLETVLKYGIQGVQQYFQTTARTTNVTQAPQQQVFLQPVIHENGTVTYIPIYITATSAPIQTVAVTPGTPVAEEGDGDDEGRRLAAGEEEEEVEVDFEGRNPPVLQYSRVGRLP